MPHKILLDTDIGSDIDDAVCLAYLLMQPECDLLGITTVTGEAEDRARIAYALCRSAGRDIPIFPGAEEPLVLPQQQPFAPHAQALEGSANQRYFQHGEAIWFMRQMIRAYPGEVTLVAIGPLTNIALLFSVDPQIPTLLKGLVIMGGVFKSLAPTLEWNMSVDPHAAVIVYRSEVAMHRSVGLDVVGQVALSQDHAQQVFKRGVLRTVLKFAGLHFQEHNRMTFYDALAAATLFDDMLCTFESGQVTVEIDDVVQRGVTRFDADRFGRHEIATVINSKRFFEHFFNVFQQPEHF